MDGCRHVEGRVLLLSDRLAVANLRFAPGGTIHEHAAPHEIDVICVAGSGFVSIEGERSSPHGGRAGAVAGGLVHCAWTEDSAMETLMVEHLRDA